MLDDKRFQSSTDLCLKVIDLMEQNCVALAQGLQGEIMDMYRKEVQQEIDRMWELRKRIMRIEHEM